MPPEAAATVAPPQVSTPGVAPVEVPPAQQPPDKREKPFQARFDAKLAELGGDDDDDAEETESETPAKAPPVPAPDKKPEPPPAAASADEPVKPSERAEFREYKRQQRELIAKERAELEKQKQEFTGTHGERLTKAESILKAIEAGDPEGFAQAVGTKDFNEFQESFIKRLADPNYKELRELQKWREDQQKQAEQQKKDQETQEANRQRAELRSKWLGDLTEKGKTSKDRVAQAMADDPMFLNVVFEIQKAHWDDSSKSTVSLEEAIDRGLPGHKTTLREELKALYDRLGKAFGEPPALAAANGRKPAPKTAVTPTKTTDAAGGKGKWNGPHDPNWRQYAARKLAEADKD